jgi:hypothetical protein
MVGLGGRSPWLPVWSTKPTVFTEPSQAAVGVGAGVAGVVGMRFPGGTVVETVYAWERVDAGEIVPSGFCPPMGNPRVWPARRGFTSSASTANAAMEITTTRISFRSIRRSRDLLFQIYGNRR